MNAHAISFGPFRLLAARRLLLDGDKPVRLGSRAFDILAALVERAGQGSGPPGTRPRVIDLTPVAAQALSFSGTTEVSLAVVGEK